MNPQSLDLEYLQCIETGHAADALRDGAGELVADEVPAAVGSTTFKLKDSDPWCEAIASEDNAKGTYRPVTLLDWPVVSQTTPVTPHLPPQGSLPAVPSCLHLLNPVLHLWTVGSPCRKVQIAQGFHIARRGGRGGRGGGSGIVEQQQQQGQKKGHRPARRGSRRQGGQGHRYNLGRQVGGGQRTLTKGKAVRRQPATGGSLGHDGVSSSGIDCQMFGCRSSHTSPGRRTVAHRHG